MRDKFETIPPCPNHRQYAVGDQVIYGAHDKAIITNASADSRLYDVEVTNNRRKSYQKEDNFVSELHKDINWMQLLPMSSMDIEGKQVESEVGYQPINYTQRDINSLILMCHNEYGGIDFEPDYQRGNVWGHEDKLLLIESIMAKRDIGKFVVNNRPWNDEGPLQEIVDGKQRLSCIKEFYEDGFKYKGKFYSELHYYDRITFKNHSVSVAMLNEASREEILKTFLAVNITGKVQNFDHIEHVKELLGENK